MSAVTRPVPELATQTPPDGSWLSAVRDALGRARVRGPMRPTTQVHPCVIGGERHLVYPAGLRAHSPKAFAELERYAQANGFRLKEDQRRGDRPVPADRRTRFLPMLVLGTGLAAPALHAETTSGPAAAPAAGEDIEEIQVLERRESAGRPYLIEAGKRYVAGPYGEVEAILGVASRVQAQGNHHRISTRRMKIPDPGSNQFVDRYDYTFPANCGGGRFSYYQGDGFAALGYYQGRKVILDVLVGGGPFTSPKLWGPYDQVLNDHMRMELMSGSGAQDGMGMLKASYSIGLMPVMAQETAQDYGTAYTEGIASAASCTGGASATVLSQR
ncbi:MAG: hypothetical protein AB7Q97_23745 [Gammaproteobacteria bacterium]